MKNFSNRKGFTLVELLIVIVVIGVLSTMMMLSSTEAVSSAKAADIISNLRNIKTAALAFYADNIDALTTNDKKETMLDQSKIPDIGTGGAEWLGKVINAHPSIMTKYLGNSNNISLNGDASANNYCKEGGYGVCCAENGVKWYAVYRFATNETSIKEKITSRATSTGLLGYDAKIANTVPPTYDKHKFVFLRIK
ncbi:MAG: type II secretion system protein [Synergistaceae bacterium]|nr:type II secretion system protein [Synergistaceae bacterium]